MRRVINVQQLIANLRSNPYIGSSDYSRTLPDGRQQTVYAVYGLRVKVSYTFRGIVGRKSALQIEAVSPTDLLSTD